ncbi:MAG TPA: DUF3472 domain-containing protein [Fibrobacteria bacterium]|nr:DUF3472 domain-containing protein [Fibrobacteria bacterium]
MRQGSNHHLNWFKSATLGTVALLAAWTAAVSANAPYVTFYYDDPAGTILVRDVVIVTENPGTYYCATGWFGTNGYSGLQMTQGQRGNDGKTFYKHLHFSLWDTPTHQAIPMIWKRPEVVVDGFGGEGTGVKSMWPFDWKTGVKYTIALKVWDTGPAQTAWGMWFKDGAKEQWYRTATWGYPQAGVKIPAGTYSFLEDYLGNNLTREMKVGPGWKKNLAGKWVAMGTCTSRERDGLTAWDVGAAGDAFRVKTGGSTQATLPNGSRLTTAVPAEPSFPAQTPILSAAYAGGKLIARWQVDDSKTPPFAYRIDVFADPGMTGTPVKTSTKTDPSALADTLASLALADGAYTVRLTLTDIFDATATAKASLTVGSSGIRRKPRAAAAASGFSAAARVFTVSDPGGGTRGADGRRLGTAILR